MRTRTENCYLLSSVSLLVLAAQALPSAAQDGGTFLGTIEIGQGKRDVRTGTAEAVTTVDAEEIADRQAGTVAELIDAVPGVNLVNGSTPTGSGINIRGYGATGTYGTDQKVLIQIDGATRGSEELYRIGNQLFTDPYLYREVEVLRGTVGSFEYGSGVVGGVVRLETIDASDMTGGDIGFKLRESLEFQSNGNGLTNSTTLAWQPTEGLELLGNYTRRTIGVQQDGDGNAINAEAGDSDLPSWLLKGRYTFGQDSAHALTFSYTDTRQDESDVPYDSFGQVDFGNVDRTTRNRTASLRYEYDPSSPMIDLDVTLAHSDEEITNDPIDPFGSPLLAADHRYQTTTFRIANTASLQTGAIGHDLRTGVEYIRRDRLDAYSAPGGVDDRIGVFAVDDMTFGGWTVTPALRYEYSRIDGPTAPNDGRFSNDALMGGLAVRYEFGNGFAIFGSGAYTEVLPIIDDLGTPLFMEQSEKSRTYEVGGSYDRIGVLGTNDRLALKANLYQTELWDVTSYSGVDRVETQGLELEASYVHDRGTYVDLNANLTRGEETALDGVRADWEGIPADSLRLTLGQRFGEELDLSWESVAAARMDRAADPSPGYVVHNLRATYVPQQGVLEGAEIRFGLENVFDQLYTPHLATRPAPGRTAKLTLAMTF